MPVRVIDRLEVVQVDDHHRQGEHDGSDRRSTLGRDGLQARCGWPDRSGDPFVLAASSIVNVCRSLRRRANACQQFGADEGFRDQVECPQVKRSGPFLGRREIAVQNHGHQPRRVFLLHPAHECQATVGRQAKLRQDQIGLEASQPRQRPRSDRPPGRPRSRRPARCCTVARHSLREGSTTSTRRGKWGESRSARSRMWLSHRNPGKRKVSAILPRDGSWRFWCLARSTCGWFS